MGLQEFLFLSLLSLAFHCTSTAQTVLNKTVFLPQFHRVFNVDHFGAKGRGGDDRDAFMNAWKSACASHVSAIYLVPEKKRYLLKPVTFHGPCNSNVTVMIKGALEASMNLKDWKEEGTAHWILFENIDNLTVGGGGTLVGNGRTWWKNSCKINRALPCTVAPTALTFYSCNHLTVENLSILESQQIHLSVETCSDVRVSHLDIDSPESSPNTDGIHVSNTKNMVISGCVIKAGEHFDKAAETLVSSSSVPLMLQKTIPGDDCVSIASGSRNIKAMDTVCGPGHGISIGSLGAHNSVENVADVVVDNVKLNGTTNGVRIKTWQGGRGNAKNILFQNIIMQNVYNPIIIDQNYCDATYPCPEQMSGVQVSKVTYKNIKGTSASRVAVNFNCSRAVPCQEIRMQEIHLVGEDGQHTESFCKHVKCTVNDMIVPPACI